MCTVPITSGSIKYKKCDKIKNRLLIGIDQGCSLTKIVYMKKENYYQISSEAHEIVTFEWAVFDNNNFEETLRYIQDIAYIAEEVEFPVHITGVGGFTEKKLLESVFGRKIEVIPEELSLSAGHIIAFSDIGIESLTKTVIKPSTNFQMINNPFERLFMSQKTQCIEKPSFNVTSPYPCLVLNCGSGAGFNYINEDGKSEIFGNFINGGKTLLGLAKCLLDINSYPEVIELARTGCKENIDTTMNNLRVENSALSQSPFGEATIVPFGKFDDLDFSLEKAYKGDIARSLIGLICLQIFTFCASAAAIKNVSKVYLNGNLFQSPLFGEELQKIASVSPRYLELIILDYGYAGSLAAMLCDAKEKSKYMIN